MPVREAQTENAAYEFDAAGNLAIRRDSQGETRFEWDANNRLVAAHTPAGDHAQYTYDPLGRRIAKEVNGRKTRFCWDGDVLLSDTSPVQPTREYVYYPETFTPLAMSVNGHTLHYHNDPVGLPHDLYTGEGDLVWSARYGPFGDANKITDEVDNPLRLQGQYYDAETGLHYNRFRYFDPAIGRFISTDPLGLAAGPDLYEYAPNVWNWVDPFGLACHHIATNKHKTLWTERFRAIFAKAGMTLNHEANKMHVSNEFHNGPHPDRYHQLVWDRLRTAIQGHSTMEAKREALIHELGSLRDHINIDPTILRK